MPVQEFFKRQDVQYFILIFGFIEAFGEIYTGYQAYTSFRSGKNSWAIPGLSALYLVERVPPEQPPPPPPTAPNPPERGGGQKGK